MHIMVWVLIRSYTIYLVLIAQYCAQQLQGVAYHFEFGGVVFECILLTLYPPVWCVDNLGKQFGPRSVRPDQGLNYLTFRC